MQKQLLYSNKGDLLYAHLMVLWSVSDPAGKLTVQEKRQTGCIKSLIPTLLINNDYYMCICYLNYCLNYNPWRCEGEIRHWKSFCKP